MISLNQARKIAEDAARLNLTVFLSDVSIPLLRHEYLEAAHCWIFFRNKEIAVPPESSLRGDWAYAVSKRGLIREVPDMSDDTQRMLAYLQKMSDYFKQIES